MAVLWMSCSENPFLGQWIQDSSPPSSLSDSVYVILCWYPLSICIWAFVQCCIWIYFSSSTWRHPVSLSAFVEDVSLLYYYSLLLVKNNVSVDMWIYVLIFSLIPLTNMSIFMTISCSSNYQMSVIATLNLGWR